MKGHPKMGVTRGGQPARSDANDSASVRYGNNNKSRKTASTISSLICDYM